MYLNQEQIKALKVLLEDNNRTRINTRTRKAMTTINRAIKSNNKRVHQQKKMIGRATRLPKIKNNNPWD